MGRAGQKTLCVFEGDEVLTYPKRGRQGLVDIITITMTVVAIGAC